MDQRLRKNERLQHRTEFQAVFARKWSQGGKFLVVYGVPNGLGYNRLGLTVGRRYGNAVRRNRFKRRCREAFRLTKHRQHQGWDWIIIPRLPKKGDPHGPTEPSFHEIQNDFLNITSRIVKRHKQPLS